MGSRLASKRRSASACIASGKRMGNESVCVLAMLHSSSECRTHLFARAVFLCSQNKEIFLEIRQFVNSGLPDVLNDCSDALPTAAAQHGGAIFQVMAPQFVHQCDRQACTACRQGMSNRDGATVDIGLIAVQP